VNPFRVRQMVGCSLLLTSAFYACAQGADINTGNSQAVTTGGASTGGTTTSPDTGGADMGQGGMTATGGSSSSTTGGASATGGRTTTNAGATSTIGGARATGGAATATGGTRATGGSPTTATGGTASATGGTVAAAGSIGNGGTIGSGGSVASGGIVATAGSTAVSNGLSLQLQGCANDCTADGAMHVYFKVINASAAAVSLADLTVRYYYTDASIDTVDIYFTDPIAKTTVTTKFVALATAVAGADHYVEYSFSTGTIAANGGTLTVTSDVHRASWATLNETDDYSYAATTAYTANDKLTVWQGTTLVWGVEPS
jgi:hypothetical protein